MDVYQTAAQLGIAHGYFDIDGQYHAASEAVLAHLSTTLQTLPNTPTEYDDVIAIRADASAQITLPASFTQPSRLTLLNEQNEAQTGLNQHHNLLTLPPLPYGYYRLTLEQATQSYHILIVCAPPHAYQPPKLAAGERSNGITLQLYSLRSHHNWGIGDFADLAQLQQWASQHHIDFIGINPLHALFTSRPDYASPYSPSSRHWLNPIYLSVPQAAQQLHLESILQTWLADPTHQQTIQTLRDAPTIDYTTVWATKRAALETLFQAFDTTEHPAFSQFIQQHGTALTGFALFEALDNHFANSETLGWLGWDCAYQHPDNPAVHTFAQQHSQEIRFYMWLQWLCACQMQAIQTHPTQLGIYGDLAVGAAQGSADTWLNQTAYCLDIAIGAPPDPLGPIGQNWQLPPLHPIELKRTGYRTFIQMLRDNMQYYGILRIDHVMVLNRLWWIAFGDTAQHGAYVHYQQDVLFAIVALESQRAQCVIIGEDLGTVPNETRELLNHYRIFSYKVLYFGLQTEQFPTQSIAVTATHDLAPFKGWWTGRDLDIMFQLGTLPHAAAYQAAQAQRQHDKMALHTLLKQKHHLPYYHELPSEATDELCSAVHRLGAYSPSKLYALQIENLLGMTDNFNVPGVATGYPNWACKLPINLEELPHHPFTLQQLTLIDEIRMKKNHTPTPLPPYPTPDQRERDTINSLFLATHGDPFSYLGRHHIDGVGDVVRCLLPHIFSVDVIERRTGKLIAPMQQIDSRGFWVAVLPDNAPDYALNIRSRVRAEAERIEDPYRYPSYLKDMDKWLLGEGTHLRPYEILGAHLIEHDGAKGVNFAVWAPNAQRVSVIGEFNNWDGRCHAMRHHSDTGIWEIFIPARLFNALYKFEIRDAHGNVRQKADPYAFAAELRPTTASVVRGLPSKMPEPAFRQKANAIDSPISIYEVHLGSWRRNLENNYWLTYEDLATELVDYVKDMGFTHIELLPISEYPFDGSWGYQATGLYAPTSRFGSPQQLQYLIQKAHDAGICVILDWVVGHFPTDEHGLAKFDGTPLYEHADPREGYHQDWNTLIYNFGRTEVKNFLQGNALYWIERFGFDGLRVDAVASMIYRDYSRKDGEWIPNQYGGRENLEAINFLRDTNTMLQNTVPSASEIAEESTSFADVTRAQGLNFQYKWNMGWMNDTLRYMKEDPINRKYHHNLMTFGMMYQYSENFVLPLSHDEVVHGKGSLLTKMPGDAWQKFANLRAYYGFMYGYPGKKLLFMGNEFAQGREWNYHEALDWFLLEPEQGGGWHKGVQDWVRDLNHTYRQHSPLYELDQWPEGFEWLVADDGNHSVFAFERRDRAGNRLIVVSNFTPVVREHYRIGVNQAGVYQEILNSDNAQYQGSNVAVFPQKVMKTEAVESHGRAQSLDLTLPPLATVYLYLPVSDALSSPAEAPVATSAPAATPTVTKRSKPSTPTRAKKASAKKNRK